MNERRIVAAIAFEPTPAPPAVPPAPSGTRTLHLAIETVDGVRNDGLLVEPDDYERAGGTLLVHGHGSGSNYLAAPNGPLAFALAARGRATLTYNNRAFGSGVNTENFFDIRRDLEAAVAVGRALGFARIVLSGHSLGTLHALFYAAQTWDARIAGLLLHAPFADLPWKTRTILMQDEAGYAELARQARAALPDASGDVLARRMGFYTGHSVPVTARHFLTYRDTTASAARSTDWIARVPYPILITRNEADGVIQPWEPHALLASAHAAGSLVPSIAYVQTADADPPSLPGHSFVGNEDALATAVVTWLAANNL